MGWGELTEIYFSGWGSAVRIRRSSRWIKTPRLSTAANERPCIPTKGRAATNRCWRCGQRWMWCWPTNFAAAPKTVTSYYYRGDSACHEKKLLRWLLDEKREGGPAGFIGLAISARMSEALHTAILEVPESGWKAYGKPEPDVDRECAEVVFVSNEELEPKGAKPLRYVAIRLRKRQGGLFADGSSVLHFAVLSNIWDWEPVKLIEWHREKAGTIERVHEDRKSTRLNS